MFDKDEAPPEQRLDAKEKSRKWRLVVMIMRRITEMYLTIVALSSALFVWAGLPAEVWQNTVVGGLWVWAGVAALVGGGYGLANVAQQGVYKWAEIKNGNPNQ